MTHEDERRMLQSFPEAKLIIAKQDCTLGNHFHKIKTEYFMLIKGNATMIIETNGEKVNTIMERGRIYTVLPNTLHSVLVTAETLLVGLCSHPYDPTDDYR